MYQPEKRVINTHETRPEPVKKGGVLKSSFKFKLVADMELEKFHTETNADDCFNSHTVTLQAHPTIFTPLAHPIFTPSIPLTSHKSLTVGVLRVRRACEGGEPNQTARSVATGATHRLHTSCTPRHRHTSYATHRLHTVDSTGSRRPAHAVRHACEGGEPNQTARSVAWRAPQSSHLARPTVITPLAYPTVFTPSTPLSVGVLRVRRASCAPHLGLRT